MEQVFRAESTHPSLDSMIARLAGDQHGAFARAQAYACGATRNMIQHRLVTGRWEKLSNDVFRMSGAPQTWRQTLIAATLQWGAGAVASHRSAAALLRIATFKPGVIELTVPRARRRAGSGVIHRNFLFEVDLIVVDGIPATTPARTLIDIASVCSREQVEEALDDALRRKMVTIARLRWRINEIGGAGGRPGIALIRSLLDARTQGIPRSVFETRLLRLMVRAGLPKPSIQYPIREAAAIVDFAFPRQKVALEADSYRWHSGRVRWESDLARRNRITSLGWRIIHITWDDLVHRPDFVIASIAHILRTRPPLREGEGRTSFD